MTTLEKQNVNLDRFIPDRKQIDFDLCNFKLTSNADTINKVCKMMNVENERILPFFARQKKETTISYPKEIKEDITPKRFFPSNTAFKVLEATNVLDDFYLNILDWSSTDLISIALSDSIYLYNNKLSKIHEMDSLYNSEYFSCVKFNDSSNTLVTGDSTSTIKVFDVNVNRILKEFTGHTSRINSISWRDENVFCSGSKDSSIRMFDVRMRSQILIISGRHNLEICGLKWSPDKTSLASGSNDNIACIWDLSMLRVEPRIIFREHIAAVKAIDFCPWNRQIIATGGGSADKKINIWDVNTGNVLKSVDTGSQISALQWNYPNKELISSHGYSSNEIKIWNPETMSETHYFSGHRGRILNLVQNKNHTQIASLSSDESLRFWKISNKEYLSTTTSKKVTNVLSSGKLLLLR